MAPIAPINLANVASIQPVTPPNAASSAEASGSFQSVFHDAVNTVENFQSKAGHAITDLLSGANGDVHTPVIAAQEANLSFSLFMQVRNKVMSAYQTLMGMQV